MHRFAWAEIDLDALRFNVRTFRHLVGPHTQVMAVVKADAYGHGAVRCARAALEAQATYLGVATADEALELRAASITAPILVLSEVPSEIMPELIAADVELTASSPTFLAAASRAAMAQGVPAYFHLKVDTGMHRIGVAPEEATGILVQAQQLPGLVLKGVFTHFATADVEGDWDVVEQLKRFERALTLIRGAGITIPLVHACNSAAAVLVPQARFDMVRIGISLYGLYSSDDTPRHIKLKPVMSIKARTTLVKEIGFGEGVSYGLTYRASRPTRIATLPLGYADGVPRVLSNRIDFLLERNGRRMPQVGRICMDQMMAEIPDNEQVGYGDTFIVIGSAEVPATTLHPAHREEITLADYARASDTIEHEIAIGFGNRLERMYLGS